MYLYPKFSGTDLLYFRLLGDGLGNMLFPWARAICLSHRLNLPLIAPTWRQYKIGPFLRNEQDKRIYGDLFRHPDQYITGVERLAALLTRPRVSEGYLFDEACDLQLKAIVNISGMDDFFLKFLTEFTLVKNALMDITKPEHKKGKDISVNAISVHVRLGDFQKLDKDPDAALKSGVSNTRIPMWWYKNAILELREVLGRDFPVIIWSDDSGERLKELTSLGNAELVYLGSSVADLIGMASAKVLVASGSTFSMWASYLGRMPTLWHPGQMRQKLLFENPSAEIEFSGGQKTGFSDDFVKTVLT